jgi:hypothetical protein
MMASLMGNKYEVQRIGVSKFEKYILPVRVDVPELAHGILT